MPKKAFMTPADILLIYSRCSRPNLPRTADVISGKQGTIAPAHAKPSSTCPKIRSQSESGKWRRAEGPEQKRVTEPKKAAVIMMVRRSMVRKGTRKVRGM